MAEGPMQCFVAEQVGVLELLAYVTVGEQPVLASDVRTVLDESLARRHDMSSVLSQAVTVEQTIGRIWSMRLTGPRREEKG